MPLTTILLNGISVTALLDSGSSISLARPSVLPDATQSESHLLVICIHCNIWDVLAMVCLGHQGGEIH